MDIKIKKNLIITIVKAIETASDYDVEFESYKVVHDLSLNKKSLQTHYEALKVMDKPTIDYRKYDKQISKLRTKHADDQSKLKEELDKLFSENENVIEGEIDRRFQWNEELDEEITVKNITLIPLKSIKGKSGSALKFISAIEPLIDFNSDESKPVMESSK